MCFRNESEETESKENSESRKRCPPGEHQREVKFSRKQRPREQAVQMGTGAEGASEGRGRWTGDSGKHIL